MNTPSGGSNDPSPSDKGRRLTFPRENRLHGEKRIGLLFLQGHALFSYPFKIVWRSAENPGGPAVQFAIAVSKKGLKHAVDRNLMKRRVRECLRLNWHQLGSSFSQPGTGLEVMLVYVARETLAYQEVCHKLLRALHKVLRDAAPAKLENTNTSEA